MNFFHQTNPPNEYILCIPNLFLFATKRGSKRDVSELFFLWQIKKD